MQSKRHRLDRFLSSRLSIKRGDVRLLVAQRRVKVNHVEVDDIQILIDEFTHLSVDGHVLQDNSPRYLMLHKPRGVVSATTDDRHKTVLDLLPQCQRDSLHIVGRLDFNSTGLILLTNDGRWSRRLTSPESAIKKRYLVTLDRPVTAEMIDHFNRGIYFGYENVMTRSATLIPLTHNMAKVELLEGRYHQIKRMFGYFQVKVLTLHRYAIGNLRLDDSLPESQNRILATEEVEQIFNYQAGANCNI